MKTKAPVTRVQAYASRILSGVAANPLYDGEHGDFAIEIPGDRRAAIAALQEWVGTLSAFDKSSSSQRGIAGIREWAEQHKATIVVTDEAPPFVPAGVPG